MTEKYDVLIIGGGMVGATVACALGNSSQLKSLPFFLWLLVAPSMSSYVSLVIGLSAAVTSFLSDVI